MPEWGGFHSVLQDGRGEDGRMKLWMYSVPLNCKRWSTLCDVYFATIFKECSQDILTPAYQNYSYFKPVLRTSNWDKNLVILTTFTVQWFLMYSQGCTAVRAISKTFPSSQKRNPISNTNHYQFSLPHYLATSNTFSVSMDLPAWDISYKWNTIMCDLLCPAS